MNSTQQTINEASRIAAILLSLLFTYSSRTAVAVSKIRVNYRWSFTVRFNNYNYNSLTAQAHAIDTFLSRTSDVQISPSTRYFGFTLTMSGVSSSEAQAYTDALRVMRALEVL